MPATLAVPARLAPVIGDTTAPPSCSIAFRRHGFVALAILLNVAAVTLIVAVYEHKFYRVRPQRGGGHHTEGFVRGSRHHRAGIAAANGLTVTSIISAHAKTVAVGRGVRSSE